MNARRPPSYTNDLGLRGASTRPGAPGLRRLQKLLCYGAPGASDEARPSRKPGFRAAPLSPCQSVCLRAFEEPVPENREGGGQEKEGGQEGEERALGSLGLEGLDAGLGLGVADRLLRLLLFPFVSIALRIFSFFNNGFCVAVNVGSLVNRSWTMSVRQC